MKDKINPLQQSSVYKIPCSCGTSYIGKTSRSFEERIKEHIEDTNHNHIAKSTIIEHSSKSKHLIHFDQNQLLARDPYYSTCLIREALKIEKNPNNLNRDDDLKLSQPGLLSSIKSLTLSQTSGPFSFSPLSLSFLIHLLAFLFLLLLVLSLYFILIHLSPFYYYYYLFFNYFYFILF